MSRELPILFNTEMVRAILYGRKTCTRRIMKPQPTAHYGTQCAKLPYVPGDILYVRETWTEECGKYYYRSDYDSDYLDPCETLSGGYPASCRNHPGCYGCTATSMRIHWHPSTCRKKRRVSGLRLQIFERSGCRRLRKNKHAWRAQTRGMKYVTKTTDGIQRFRTQTVVETLIWSMDFINFGTPPSRNPTLTVTDGKLILGYGLSSLRDATKKGES